tara:strand:- start:63 stop:866 length:804 start_codon:yes stop_codon:yes gene_type:complete
MTAIKKLMNLSGRSVVITGATGNLGTVMCHSLAELGAEIILIDRHGSDFTKLKKEIILKWSVDCYSYECDLEIEEDRKKVIKEILSTHRHISCLVNNAAFVGTSTLSGWGVPLKDQSLETWRRAMEVNVTAVFHLSQALAPTLKKSDGGNIINISSIYGEHGPDWSLYEGLDMNSPAAYAVSKGGVNQLTRWLATTLSPEIRVNAIAPGGIFRGQPKKFIERYEIKTPLGRMATEDDFRGAIAYLASDLSSYVTGQVLQVDGGWGVW